MKLLALMLLVASPALAQTPPPGARQIKIDVSPAGQVVLKKYLGTPDPAIVQQVNQLRAVQQQIVGLSSAARLDLVRLEALMRRQEGLEASLKRRSNDRSLQMLRALSEADRLKFVRSFRAAQAGARPPAR